MIPSAPPPRLQPRQSNLGSAQRPSSRHFLLEAQLLFRGRTWKVLEARGSSWKVQEAPGSSWMLLEAHRSSWKSQKAAGSSWMPWEALEGSGSLGNTLELSAEKLGSVLFVFQWKRNDFVKFREALKVL